MAKPKKGKPGVMLYFKYAPAMKKLSDEEAGQIFKAILQYGQTKEEPILSGDLALAWEFIRPDFDSDDERYRDTVQVRAYGGYCKNELDKGREPLSRKEWEDNTSKQMLAHASMSTHEHAHFANSNTNNNTNYNLNSNNKSNAQEHRFAPTSQLTQGKYQSKYVKPSGELGQAEEDAIQQLLKGE